MLGYGKIWLTYNYLNNWNLRVQKQNIEKIAFKVVQITFWLLLQIYPCYLWLVLWSSVTYLHARNSKCSMVFGILQNFTIIFGDSYINNHNHGIATF